MKKFTTYILFAFLFFSCQKELNFDNISSGSLKRNAVGDCLPATTGGTFITGINLADTNYIEVSVNVITAGNYVIKTDTVNGYSFRGSGSFSSAGTSIVKLKGTGKPIAAGSNNFTVSYDTSHCVIAVNVILPPGTIGPAVYTLAGAPNTCTPAEIAGSYIKNIPLNSDDTVTIALMVTVAGNYSISTNTVNGYSFSGTGIVTGTGLQKIRLTATGTPLLEGDNIFTVTAGISSCTFSVTTTLPVIVTGTDYFPLTKNSYWTYDDLFNTGDTLKRIITDTVTKNGNLYSILNEVDMIGTIKKHFFRKAGAAYFEYGSVDQYTNSLVYVPEVDGDIKFLKENLATGDTWVSDEYVGNLFSGQPVYTRYDYTCVDANAAITLNGKSFINVYKILLLPQVRSSTTFPFNSTAEIIELYYAKGIGLIYVKGSSNGFPKKEWRIKNWMVY